MSLLTPLYIAGVLAVALPVLFHLLRRAPQKKQTFSSLMFLAPTPPRFTRRSRISNWLLLLLRAAVLTLLAMAFARPFFRDQVALSASGTSRRHIAILVDTSASMRRGDLWTQAKQHVNQVLNGIGAGDEASLYFFDRTVRSAFSFEQWNRLEAGQRSAAVQGILSAASPTWESTSIGDAVGSVAEQLAGGNTGKDKPDAGPRTVVLISDLQQGGRPEGLQAHAWPEAVRLDVRAVVAKPGTNAGVQWIAPPADAASTELNRPRVRITNGSDSTSDQFTLVWTGLNATPVRVPPIKVYAPPGRSQMVRVDRPADAATADRLVLQGDDHDFDNTLYVAPARQQASRVLYVGRDVFDDPNGSAFYLRTAFGETPQRRIDVTATAGDALVPADIANAGLVVLDDSIPSPAESAVRKYMDAGGSVLWILRDAADGQQARQWLGDERATVEEAATGGFALLSRLDTSHPVLAAFADPRFGDFGRVHFWKHRKLTVTGQAGIRVLAGFDNGDPYLLEKTIGRGRLFVMTSGWRPADSQLALSSKFVPILENLLRPREDALQQTQFTVGDVIASPVGAGKLWTAKAADGRLVMLSDGLTEPGVYTVETGAGPVIVAANLRPDESRTVPISPNDFRQWGAKLESENAHPASAEEQRQAQRAELENQQKLWQWLIVGVLGLIAAETILAGSLARRGTGDGSVVTG